MQVAYGQGTKLKKIMSEGSHWHKPLIPSVCILSYFDAHSSPSHLSANVKIECPQYILNCYLVHLQKYLCHVSQKIAQYHQYISLRWRINRKINGLYRLGTAIEFESIFEKCLRWYKPLVLPFVSCKKSLLFPITQKVRFSV